MLSKVLFLIHFCLQGFVASEFGFKNLNATINVESSSALGQLVFTLTTNDEHVFLSAIVWKTDSEYFESNPTDSRKIVVKSCLPAGVTEVLEFSTDDRNHGYSDDNILTLNISPVTPVFSVPSRIIVPVDWHPYEVPRIIDVLPITFSNSGECTFFRCNLKCTNDEKHFWIEADTNIIRTFVQDLVYEFVYELRVTCSDVSGGNFMPESISETNVITTFTESYQPGANDSLALSHSENELRYETNLDKHSDPFHLNGKDAKVAMFDMFDVDGDVYGRHKRAVTTSAPGSNVGYNVVTMKPRCLCSNNFPRPGPNGFFIRRSRPVKAIPVKVLTPSTTTITTITSTVSTTAQNTTTNTGEAATTTISELPNSKEPTTTNLTQMTTSDGPKATDATQLTPSTKSLTTEMTPMTLTDTTLTDTSGPTMTESTQQSSTDVLTTTEQTQLTRQDEPTTTATTDTTTNGNTELPISSESSALNTAPTATTEPSLSSTTKFTTTDVPSGTATSSVASAEETSILPTTKKATTVSEEATNSISKYTTDIGHTVSRMTQATSTIGGSNAPTSAGPTTTLDQQQTTATSSHTTSQTPNNQPGTTDILHAETPGPGFFDTWSNLWAIIGGGGGIALIGLSVSFIYKAFTMRQCCSPSIGTSSVGDANNLQYIGDTSDPVQSGDTSTSSTAALVPNEGGLTPVGS